MITTRLLEVTRLIDKIGEEKIGSIHLKYPDLDEGTTTVTVLVKFMDETQMLEAISFMRELGWYRRIKNNGYVLFIWVMRD